MLNLYETRATDLPSNQNWYSYKMYPYEGYLTPNEKGFLYEMDCWNLLDRNGISYDSNPQTYDEWVHNNKKFDGFDILVSTSGGNIKVECKLTLTDKIYDSWFNRDWYSRKGDIIVTNDKSHLSREQRNRLKEKEVLLMYDYELVAYILEKCGSSNKYYLNHCEKKYQILQKRWSKIENQGSRANETTSYGNSTPKIDQLENDGRLVSSPNHGYFVPPESTTSSSSLVCRHIKSVGFSSAYTILSGLGGGLREVIRTTGIGVLR